LDTIQVIGLGILTLPLEHFFGVLLMFNIHEQVQQAMKYSWMEFKVMAPDPALPSVNCQERGLLVVVSTPKAIALLAPRGLF
jgi:hypothetical protein